MRCILIYYFILRYLLFFLSMLKLQEKEYLFIGAFILQVGGNIYEAA